MSKQETTKEKTANNQAESKRSEHVTGVNAVDEEAWKTRVYENDLARMTRKHTWIGEEDDAERLRNSSAGTRAEAAGRETRVFEGPASVRQYVKPEIAPPLSEQRRDSAKKTGSEAPAAPKGRSMRRVRIGDRKRFKRLLAVLAVIALIIAFEAGFFVMQARINKLPGEIKAVNEQTADMKADNEKLQADNEKLGDSESKKELKESWERLRDKVKEAVGETSS